MKSGYHDPATRATTTRPQKDRRDSNDPQGRNERSEVAPPIKPQPGEGNNSKATWPQADVARPPACSKKLGTRRCPAISRSEAEWSKGFERSATTQRAKRSCSPDQTL